MLIQKVLLSRSKTLDPPAEFPPAAKECCQSKYSVFPKSEDNSKGIVWLVHATSLDCLRVETWFHG